MCTWKHTYTHMYIHCHSFKSLQSYCYLLCRDGTSWPHKRKMVCLMRLTSLQYVHNTGIYSTVQIQLCTPCMQFSCTLKWFSYKVACGSRFIGRKHLNLQILVYSTWGITGSSGEISDIITVVCLGYYGIGHCIAQWLHSCSQTNQSIHQLSIYNL